MSKSRSQEIKKPFVPEQQSRPVFVLCIWICIYGTEWLWLYNTNINLFTYTLVGYLFWLINVTISTCLLFFYALWLENNSENQLQIESWVLMAPGWAAQENEIEVLL